MTSGLEILPRARSGPRALLRLDLVLVPMTSLTTEGCAEAHSLDHEAMLIFEGQPVLPSRAMPL